MRSYRRVEIIACLEIIERIKDGGELQEALADLIAELRSGEPWPSAHEPKSWLIKAHTGPASTPMYLAMLGPADRHWTTNRCMALSYASCELAEADIQQFNLMNCEVVEYET